jgi:imidazole glycerol-phosphate synthase subunit HisH
MIAIINYGSGNIQAIANIYGKLNLPFTVASTPNELLTADKALLPGVGAFDQAMNELERSDMRRALDQFALQDKKPILGICVGMQLLANSSEEGNAAGLGWIDGVVKRFDHHSFNQPTHLPHMGWNNVAPTQPNRLFDSVDLGSGYYFLHSYYFACNNERDILASTDYGVRFASAVHRENIYGVQFHPEKSHHAGIQLLKNFALNSGL